MKPTSEELQIINSRLPGTTLKESQVEILPFRLFDNQLTDRYTIMSPEMMKKLVMDANNGLIAMNAMHQSRDTLSFGRSVTGQIKKNGAVSELQVKMYAITQRPDGTPMEDGKDVADRYNTGAVYACSAGVQVGFYQCSICGNDIRDWQNCDHYPGEIYQINEKPVVATALMTGHDIQDGMAMDCTCYECSAVTAGGVRQASILTESFSHYSKDSDLKDFKKSEFENKEIIERITLMPYAATIQTTTEEEVPMVDKELVDKNYELIAEKAKIEVAHATLQGEFNLLTTTHEATKAEYAKVQAEQVETLAKIEEFTKKVEELTASVTEYEAKVAEVEPLKAFKTAYISIVEADGVKISREADYASKTLEELQALHTEYLAEIAKIPSGQHTTGDDEPKPVVNSYAGIPDDFFKAR